jgi:hypothetical protein
MPSDSTWKDCRRVGIFQNLVGGRVGEPKRHQIELLAGHSADVFHRQLDNRQVAQAEEVELHQTGFFNVILVELRHRRSIAAGAPGRSGKTR